MSHGKHILGELRSNCCHFLAHKQSRTCWYWKNEQAESTSKKGDYLDLWMLLLGMHKQYRWQHLAPRGAFWHWCRLSDVSLFHCSPDCVAALEPWSLAFLFHFSFPLISGHCPFTFLVYSSSTVPSFFGTSELVADLAGRWDTGMVPLLNILCFCPPGKSHQSSVDFRVGQTTLEWPLGLPVFGGGESLAVGYRTGSGCISSWDLRAALCNVLIKKKKCVFSSCYPSKYFSSDSI